MPDVKVILFDLGSTLMWFDGDWHGVLAEADQAMCTALIHLGYAIAPAEFSAAFEAGLTAYYTHNAPEFIHYTSENVVRHLLNEAGYPEASIEHIRCALNAMYAVTHAHWKLEGDALSTLERLRAAGYRLGILTNAADDADAYQYVDDLGLSPYFEVVISSAGTGMRKPNPRIFHLALAQFGVTAQQAVMVGDTLGADILGAQHAGMRSIWVTRRADRPDNRAHLDTIVPDVTVATLAEIPAVLSE